MRYSIYDSAFHFTWAERNFATAKEAGRYLLDHLNFTDCWPMFKDELTGELENNFNAFLMDIRNTLDYDIVKGDENIISKDVDLDLDSNNYKVTELDN
ncbi:MAG: hypothetical protein Q8L68_03275 [Methylococcales bacterium]|nr:hypothetical protein [Methylococcales bacterium]